MTNTPKKDKDIKFVWVHHEPDFKKCFESIVRDGNTFQVNHIEFEMKDVTHLWVGKVEDEENEYYMGIRPFHGNVIIVYTGTEEDCERIRTILFSFWKLEKEKYGDPIEQNDEPELCESTWIYAEEDFKKCLNQFLEMEMNFSLIILNFRWKILLTSQLATLIIQKMNIIQLFAKIMMKFEQYSITVLKKNVN